MNLAQLSQRIASDQQNMHADDANKDFDPDLLDIFLEEAEELLWVWMKTSTRGQKTPVILRH